MIVYILLIISMILMIVFAIIAEAKEREIKSYRENEDQLVKNANEWMRKYEASVKEKREICQKNLNLARESFTLEQTVERIDRKSQHYLDAISYFNQMLSERISPVVKIEDSDLRRKEWDKVFNILVDKINTFMKKAREEK